MVGRAVGSMPLFTALSSLAQRAPFSPALPEVLARLCILRARSALRVFELDFARVFAAHFAVFALSVRPDCIYLWRGPVTTHL